MILFKNEIFTNKKRITELLIISITMNSVLFIISYYLNLPLWLDTTGTIYISCIIGYPVGFLVAIINNIFEAIWIYGEESLLFYFVSLFSALTAGYIYAKFKGTKAKKWVIMVFALFIVEGVSAVLITFLVNNGIPSNYWSKFLYTLFQKNGWSSILSTCISVLAIKCPDIIISVLIVIFSIKITPKKLKTEKVAITKHLEDTVI